MEDLGILVSICRRDKVSPWAETDEKNVSYCVLSVLIW